MIAMGKEREEKILKGMGKVTKWADRGSLDNVEAL